MTFGSFIDRPHRFRFSHRSLAALVVGAVIGVGVGGVGISIASTSQSVTFCVNKRTQVVRLAKAGRCGRTETRLAMNTSGVAGAPGAPGPAGANGATGPTGAQGVAGAPGATGPQGAIGPIGATGPPGAQGIAGTPGAAGAAGSRFTNMLTDYLPVDAFRSRQNGYEYEIEVRANVFFYLTCWNEASAVSPVLKHVLEYTVQSNDKVVTTAHVVGGTSSATTVVTNTGRQDLAAIGTNSRYEILVLNDPNVTAEKYEFIVTMTSNQCEVSWASQR